jgi:hypothetical protein
MENLNTLEIALLEAIIEENKGEYPFLTSHFPLLRVNNREYTGVGLYSNFEYLSPIQATSINGIITSKKELVVKGIKNPLSYVLDITNGKINYLEVVTNGNEDWNGNADIFELK